GLPAGPVLLAIGNAVTIVGATVVHVAGLIGLGAVVGIGATAVAGTVAVRHRRPGWRTLPDGRRVRMGDSRRQPATGPRLSSTPARGGAGGRPSPLAGRAGTGTGGARSGPVPPQAGVRRGLGMLSRAGQWLGVWEPRASRPRPAAAGARPAPGVARPGPAG